MTKISDICFFTLFLLMYHQKYKLSLPNSLGIISVLFKSSCRDFARILSLYNVQLRCYGDIAMPRFGFGIVLKNAKSGI